jgi:O-antigen ligase
MSFYHNANILGVAMAHGLVLTVPLLLTRTPERWTLGRGFLWFGLLGAALILLGALVATFSRASLLYALVALVTLALCHRRLRLILAGVATVGGLSLLVLPLPAWLLFGFRVSSGMSFRASLWRSGWEIMMDNPWTGIGSGLQVFEAYRPAYLDIAAHRGLLVTQAGGAHNVFLTKGAEMGIAGLILVLVLFIILWSRIPGALRDYARGDWLAGAAAAGVLGLSVRALFESYTTLMMAHIEDSLFFFLLGLVLVGRKKWDDRGTASARISAPADQR